MGQTFTLLCLGVFHSSSLDTEHEVTNPNEAIIELQVL